MSFIIFDFIFQHGQLEIVVNVQNLVLSRVDVWSVKWMCD